MLEFENRIGVKICGVTNVADAEDCAAAGADMIGLNFSALSPRCISPSTAAEVVALVRRRFPVVRFVGVFVNQDLAVVRSTARGLALDAVQLHGDETPEYLRGLDHLCVIKALRVGLDFNQASVAGYPSNAILLDAWSSTGIGGTGQTFPWAIAASLRPRVNRLILAGGLTSENVAEAIRLVRPFAVDVCSGVESSPGKKDPRKVRRFIERLR